MMRPAVEPLSRSSPSAKLPFVSASKVKTRGWRGIMADVRKEGHLLITNHHVPEAVILPPEQYDQLVRAAQMAQLEADPQLEALRQRFDARLSRLNTPGAGEQLMTAFRSAPHLNKKVIAGATF